MKLIFHFRYQNLFYMHNVRSVLYIILFVLATCEVAESYLAVELTSTQESYVISPLQIGYSWTSFISILLLIVFVRIVEIYDKAGKYPQQHATNDAKNNNLN